jgi:hypothetical protein
LLINCVINNSQENNKALLVEKSVLNLTWWYPCANRKFKMAATSGHNITWDPMGKKNKSFFSETTNLIVHKLYMKYY